MSAYYGYYSGHYLTVDSTSPPFTMAIWVKLDTLGGSTGNTIAFELTSGVLYYNHWIYWDNGVDKWRIGARAGGPEVRAQQTSAASTDWMHIAGVTASTTSRRLFINGVEEASNSDPVNYASTKLSVGFRTDGGVPSPSGSMHFVGQAADAALWSSALTAAQVASLAAGASPLVVSPADLRFYAPLVAGSGKNLRGPALTSYGSPTAGNSHPRLYKP